MISIPYKITLTGDKDYAQKFIGAGRSQMRILEDKMSFQNLEQGVRRVRLNSRTTVTAIVCFDLKEVIIDCLPFIEEEKEEKKEYIKKPIVLVAVCHYTHPVPPAININSYLCNHTYPYKVMLYDVKEDKIIETKIGDTFYKFITTTELKKYYGINVWHYDYVTGKYIDRGLRLSDDLRHRKSYPLSRYLQYAFGYMGTLATFADGAQSSPAIRWTSDVLSDPPVPTNPDVPSLCTGVCWWDQSYYRNANTNTEEVDTKDTGLEIINSRSQIRFIGQHDLVLYNAKRKEQPFCPSGTIGFTRIPGALIGRVYWLCERTTAGTTEIILNDYQRFGGSCRLTTRNQYPLNDAGCVGYIETRYSDYRNQSRHVPGGMAWGGGGPVPCPTDIYSWDRDINIILECSFGEIYETDFSSGTYQRSYCIFDVDFTGEDREFPGCQQAFIGIEAGIVNGEVISVANVVAGTERLAHPYAGTASCPGCWSPDVYVQPKVQNVKAGINVIELDKNLEYTERILSANDIDYFSLKTGIGNFEVAVSDLVDEYYKQDPPCFDFCIDPRICLESRVIEQRTEIEELNGNRVETVSYGSCSEPNPWLSPIIGKPFWRPL